MRLYCYKGRTTGVNALGAQVTMRIYQPCSCSSNIVAFEAEILQCNNKVQKLMEKIGLTEDDYQKIIEIKQ